MAATSCSAVGSEPSNAYLSTKPFAVLLQVSLESDFSFEV